jgi:hypothetical protein
MDLRSLAAVLTAPNVLNRVPSGDTRDRLPPSAQLLSLLQDVTIPGLWKLLGMMERQ